MLSLFSMWRKRSPFPRVKQKEVIDSGDKLIAQEKEIPKVLPHSEELKTMWRTKFLDQNSPSAHRKEVAVACTSFQSPRSEEQVVLSRPEPTYQADERPLQKQTSITMPGGAGGPLSTHAQIASRREAVAEPHPQTPHMGETMLQPQANPSPPQQAWCKMTEVHQSSIDDGSYPHPLQTSVIKLVGSRCMLRCILANVYVSAIYDTAAQVCLVSRSWLERHQLNKCIQPISSKITMIYN